MLYGSESCTAEERLISFTGSLRRWSTRAAQHAEGELTANVDGSVKAMCQRSRWRQEALDGTLAAGEKGCSSGNKGVHFFAP